MNRPGLDATLDRYLGEVVRRLGALRREQREEVLAGLREHIADLTAEGATPDEILAQLGSPGSVADAAAAELPARRRFWDAKRWVQLASVMLAFGGSWMVLYATVYVEYSESSDGSGSETYYRLSDTVGVPTALALAAVPLVLTIVPAVLHARPRQAALVLCTALLAIGTVLAGFTIGSFFIATLVVAIAACIVPPRR